MSDKTKIIVCLKMLPQTTPSSLKMALKGIKDFEGFKDELRSNIKYLHDFGGLASAHLIGEEVFPHPTDPGVATPAPSESESQVNEEDIPAFVLQYLHGPERDGLVAAINRSVQQKKGTWRPGGGDSREPGRPHLRGPPRIPETPET